MPISKSTRVTNSKESGLSALAVTKTISPGDNIVGHGIANTICVLKIPNNQTRNSNIFMFFDAQKNQFLDFFVTCDFCLCNRFLIIVFITIYYIKFLIY